MFCGLGCRKIGVWVATVCDTDPLQGNIIMNITHFRITQGVTCHKERGRGRPCECPCLLSRGPETFERAELLQQKNEKRLPFCTGWFKLLRDEGGRFLSRSVHDALFALLFGTSSWTL